MICPSCKEEILRFDYSADVVECGSVQADAKGNPDWPERDIESNEVNEEKVFLNCGHCGRALTG